MIYEYRCTKCEDHVVERKLSMADEIPAAVQEEDGCPVCGGQEFRRVWSVFVVPFRVRTGREMGMRERFKRRDPNWKKRVMGEKYDGR